MGAWHFLVLSAGENPHAHTIPPFRWGFWFFFEGGCGSANFIFMGVGIFPINLGPATTQNRVVKFDGEICRGVLVEDASDNFPAKEARKCPSKLRRKFATNFAENFANFTLEIAGAY